MSRRSARREKRNKQRLEKKNRLKQYDDFEKVASIKSLYNSAKKASKGVKWKASVQRYLLSILFKISRTRKDLLNNKDIRGGFIEFVINERGKSRNIKSVHFNERVVQKSICLNALYPVLTHNLIYDNCASQKSKGTHFASKRLEKHLHWFFNHYGRNGYILLIDFKKYFESIPHDIVKRNFRKFFTDEKLLKLADDFVNAFGECGLGLGSETSQINAIAHINDIDHYIKEQKRIHCYGRYMDDSYIIYQDREYLRRLLENLEELYKSYGVTINKNKTKIIPLTGSFTYLKTRYSVTETGKVIKKPCRDSIVRQRKRMKRQAILVSKGLMTTADVQTGFTSWIGSMIHRHSRKTVFNMKNLYNDLFKKGVQNDTSNFRNETKQNTRVFRPAATEK